MESRPEDVKGRDVKTHVAYMAVCQYCSQLIECVGGLNSGSSSDRVKEWAHRLGVGSYKTRCDPEKFTKDWVGHPYGLEASPRERADGSRRGDWMGMVSVDGTDYFGQIFDSEEEARRAARKYLVWNIGES